MLCSLDGSEWEKKLTLSAVIEAGLNEAGTAVAVIAYPERGATGILDYVNRPFSAVLRRPQQELTGATVQQVLDLVGTTDCRERLLQSLRTGAPIELDVPLLAGGAESWLGMRLSYPAPNASGVRNAILIGRDITAARRNATQEDKMRQMLAQIFMRIAAPVAIVGQAGELVMCNTAFRQLTGFSAEELKRIRAHDLTPPEFVDAVAKARDAQFATGERYELEFQTLVKGGHRVAVRMTSMLLSDSDQQYRVVTLIPRTVAGNDVGPVEAAALTAAVKAYATRDRGELRAISLEALRTLCGADWERIAVRAMMRAEHAIRKRLERDDVVSRLSDTEFVVWFSNEDQTRNALTLQAIVRDVRLSFLTEFGEEISSYVSATLVPAVTAAPAAAPAVTGKTKAVTVHYTNMQGAAAKSAAE